jgi:hypothetical protein
MALVRKNVMVEAGKVRELAERLGMSESEAIRYAVDRLLHVQEFRSTVAELQRRGGIDDVFGRTEERARRGGKAGQLAGTS